MKRILLFSLAVLGLMLLAMWLFLQSALLNGVRSEMFERILSEQIGQPVKIDGTVKVELGATITVEVTEASIPSVDVPDIALAEVEYISLRARAGDLLDGSADFDGLVVRGMNVSVVRMEDGRTTWSRPGAPRRPENTTREVGDAAADALNLMFDATSLLNYVLARSERLSNVNWQFENRQSGFVFDYDLNDMIFERNAERDTLRVVDNGKLNGQPFASDSQFTVNGPFFYRSKVGGLSVEFAGESFPGEERLGYTARLTAQSNEFGDILDLVGLNRTIEGSGELTADISGDGGVVSVSDLSFLLKGKTGRTFEATGQIGDLKALKNLNIFLDLQLLQDGEELVPAESIEEFQVGGVSARVQSRGFGVSIEDTVLRTNAFTQSFDEFGPISVGLLRRTEDGRLELLDIDLQAGPLETPYIQATGEILKGMSLSAYAFEGRLDLPAGVAFAGLDRGRAEAFGRVQGGFAFDDRDGFGRLRYLNLETADTDLWQLEVRGQGANEAQGQDAQASLDLRVPESSLFFAALDKPSMDLGPLRFGFDAAIRMSRLETALALQAGGSDLSADFVFERPARKVQLGGEIRSSALVMSDVQKMMQSLKAVSSLNDAQPSPEGTSSDARDEIPVQPLLLPDVADTAEQSLDALLAQEGVQPLVLSELDDPGLADFFDPDIILRHMDVDLAIAIERLSGVKGVTRIDSAFTASGGQGQLAPIRFRYGAGSFDAVARMNVIDAPNLVRLSGSAAGWDLGDVLAMGGGRLDASGTLGGTFDLTGQYSSVKTFLNTMGGRATLRMSDGTIATSLLELAGLGVFPWLFSQERRERQTAITCVTAPMRIAAGAVSSDQAVLETRRVQLVAQGSLDFRRDTIDLRAQVRPVGRPLARSAWPFEVSGKLSAPQFNTQQGGSRVRRADGANVMPANRQPCVPDIAQLRSN